MSLIYFHPLSFHLSRCSCRSHYQARLIAALFIITTLSIMRQYGMYLIALFRLLQEFASSSNVPLYKYIVNKVSPKSYKTLSFFEIDGRVAT